MDVSAFLLIMQVERTKIGGDLYITDKVKDVLRAFEGFSNSGYVAAFFHKTKH